MDDKCGTASDQLSEEELATLAFFSVEGIGPVTLTSLRLAFGSLAEALAAPGENVRQVLRDDATRQRFAGIADLRRLADRCLEGARRAGARILFPGRPGWPRQLEGCAFPPVVYVRGNLEPLARRVAIVGSRQTDDYGRELAAFFAAGLAREAVAVVSGGAVGVDGAAHRAAIGNGAATVAVLGSGVDVVYPSEHTALFQEIVARGGALVSHFPPGTPAVQQNFRVRNRLIAGLCDLTLVIRAGLHSGALGTAQATTELKRPLFAVPGDVTCELAAGVNALLESGQARAVAGLKPLGDALGLQADWISLGPTSAGPPVRARSQCKPVPLPSAVRGATAAPADLPAELRPVYDALGDSPTQFDELLEKCALDAAHLANALLTLELMGLCEERLGKVFARR
jgi:DNA processing protein